MSRLLKSTKNVVQNKFQKYSGRLRDFFSYWKYYFHLNEKPVTKINIGSGPTLLEGYCNIDLVGGVDLALDLEKRKLPFPDNSIEVAVCISTINYFSKKTGQHIIDDVYRVLKAGGRARFATQDFELIARKYSEKDTGFFFQKLPNGEQRFKGETACDMLNAWFYGGYGTAGGKFVKYFYDYETLARMFQKAGFREVVRKNYLESSIVDIEKIDNRADQMFFLEAVK